MPAETHQIRAQESTSDLRGFVCDELAERFGRESVAGTNRLDVLGVDDLLVLDLWEDVTEEFGERGTAPEPDALEFAETDTVDELVDVFAAHLETQAP